MTVTIGENSYKVNVTVKNRKPEYHEGSYDCEYGGTLAYWLDTDTNKYYADEELTTELTQNEINLSATGAHMFGAELVEMTEEMPWGETITSYGHECTKCGYFKAHSSCYEYVQEKEATCTEAGNKAYTHCSVCDKYYVDEFDEETWQNVTIEITDPAELIIPKKAHEFPDEWQTKAQATCEEYGIKIRKCNNCDKTEYEVLAPLGHNLEHFEAYAPTCYMNGEKESWRCTICDKEFADETCVIEVGMNHFDNWQEYIYIAPLGHTYGEWVVTKNPTTTEKGEKKHTCIRCDAYETEEIPEIECEHSLTKIDAVAPTCTENGHSDYWYCSLCENYFADEDGLMPTTLEETVIEATGHSASEWIITKNPSCTEKGSKHIICTVCNAELEVEEIDVVDHIISDWIVVKEATCTEIGSKHKVCTMCNVEMETADIDALGHDYQTTVVAPTCTEKGYTDHVCSRCKDSIKDTYVDELGHNYDDGVVTPATCIAQGYTTYTCERCGHSYKDNYVDVSGHNYGEGIVTAPTCSAAGFTTHTCTVCGESYKDNFVSAMGHTFGDWTIITQATCTVNGEETRECSVCHYVETKLIVGTHDYKAVVTQATCATDGFTTYTCSVCEHSYIDSYVGALGHDYVATVTDATCTAAGYTTHVCTRCQNTYVDEYVSALGHDYDAVLTKATCTEAGYTTYTCAHCDDSYVAGNVDALGHNFGEWAVTKEAQVGVKGEETRTCSVCGEKETRLIPSLPYVPDVSRRQSAPSSNSCTAFACI